MSDHRDIDNESRVLTLQAAVFRALRDQGLEPDLSDTSAGRVPPADTLHQQLSRVAVSSEIVAHLRSTIGLDESERGWVYRVVDAAYRRCEQRQALNRCATTVAHEPVAPVSTNTTTATTVVFRRRTGVCHE